jgi:hypothetical protein
MKNRVRSLLARGLLLTGAPVVVQAAPPHATPPATKAPPSKVPAATVYDLKDGRKLSVTGGIASIIGETGLAPAGVYLTAEGAELVVGDQGHLDASKPQGKVAKDKAARRQTQPGTDGIVAPDM